MITSAVLAACLAAAAANYGMPLPVLEAIHDVEGCRLGQRVWNKNQTYDMGPMCINSSWVKRISVHWGVTEARAADVLTNEPCPNTAMAAWVLRECVRERGDFWAGVGCYNSTRRDLGEVYARKVYKALVRRHGTAVFVASR